MHCGDCGVDREHIVFHCFSSAWVSKAVDTVFFLFLRNYFSFSVSF